MRTWPLLVLTGALLTGCSTSAPPNGPADDGLLTATARGGDGDSWRDTEGREYRLGMVNAPERGECFGAEATAERRRLVADGFRAEVYTDDRYGRGVSVVTTANGRNLNVLLARTGFVDDRYLEQFRAQRPELAAQLDAAFAAAQTERAGLWGACSGAVPGATRSAAAAPSAPPVGPGCQPAYDPCVALTGDGSGDGDANDLDCPQIGRRVQVREPGSDPYRLDVDGNGLGCEPYA